VGLPLPILGLVAHLAIQVQAGLVEKCRQGSRHVYRWPARRLFIGVRTGAGTSTEFE
jgi:hypothetical protein